MILSSREELDFDKIIKALADIERACDTHDSGWPAGGYVRQAEYIDQVIMQATNEDLIKVLMAALRKLEKRDLI